MGVLLKLIADHKHSETEAHQIIVAQRARAHEAMRQLAQAELITRLDLVFGIRHLLAHEIETDNQWLPDHALARVDGFLLGFKFPTAATINEVDRTRQAWVSARDKSSSNGLTVFATCPGGEVHDPKLCQDITPNLTRDDIARRLMTVQDYNKSLAEGGCRARALHDTLP